MKRLSIATLAIASATALALGAGSAQAAPTIQDRVFDPTCVSQIAITAPQSSIDALYADPKGAYQPATMTFDLCGDPPQHFGPLTVTFRLKGSGSFRTLDGKAAFKIKMPSGNRIDGLKSLTLNNMVEDWSNMHEALAYQAFRAVGINASRAGFATVSVNGVDYGLHADVESIDDRFAAAHFPSMQHVYEAPDWMTGNSTFASRDILPPAVPNFQIQEGDKNSTTDLAALAQISEIADDADWWAAFQQKFDTAEVMKFWAVEAYLGDPDSYLNHVNNYYLHSTTGGVFSFIPWGTDMSFMQYYPLDLSQSDSLVVARCRAYPPCYSSYVAALHDVAEQIIALDLVGQAHTIDAAIAPAIAADTRREMSLPEQCWATFSMLNYLIELEHYWSQNYRPPGSGIVSAQSSDNVICPPDEPQTDPAAGGSTTQAPAQPRPGTNDVDGDGRLDVVELRPAAGLPAQLVVELAGGVRLTAWVGKLGASPAILRAGNFDGRPGDEILIATGRASGTYAVALYSYRAGALDLVGKLPAGGTTNVKYGFKCVTSSPRRVVAYRFTRGSGGWTRRTLVRRWVDGELVRSGRTERVAIDGAPPKRQTGIGC